MLFKIPKFTPPDFSRDFFVDAPNATLVEVEKDGVAPENYHAMTVFPEYIKINGKWILATESRMDTVCVANDEPGNESVEVVEFRKLKKGDKVVVGRKEDGSEGIYVHTKGFMASSQEKDTFAFRGSRSRETAFSIDYDQLYKILEHEKENNGYVTWVLGTAVSLDPDSRFAMEQLIRKGYVDAIISGTAAMAFDLERATFGTTWGQKVFKEEKSTLDNYFETINMVREIGSINEFVATGIPKDGIVKACVECNIPIIVGGTIRDRLGLPETYDNVYEAQDAMRKHIRKSSTVIMISAMLFSIATGNMTPSYNKFDNNIRPVYIYSVDIQEFAVNKLSDRGTLTAKSIVTNAQDFMRNVGRALT